MSKQQMIEDFNYNIDFLNEKLLKINKDIEKTKQKIDLIKSFNDKDLENISFNTSQLIDNSINFSKAEFFKIKKSKDYDFEKIVIILGYKKQDLNNKNYKIFFKPININIFNYKSSNHLIRSCNDSLSYYYNNNNEIKLVDANLNEKITESLKDACIDYYQNCLHKKQRVSEESLHYNEYLRLKSLSIFK